MEKYRIGSYRDRPQFPFKHAKTVVCPLKFHDPAKIAETNNFTRASIGLIVKTIQTLPP